MNCKNCGESLNHGDIFCGNCGTKVETIIENNQVETNSNINIVNHSKRNLTNEVPINNNVAQQTNTNETLQKPKKNKLVMILAIIGGFVVGLIIIVLAIFSITSSNSDKLVCKSKEGNITIMYNESGITGYTASGIGYNLEEQKLVAEKFGINRYITEFNNWFISNTSGSCTIKGKHIEENLEEDNEETNVVGDNKYGYINIPKNWGKFYDVDGNTSLQYSYANLYIVSLNYFEDSMYTAEEYASNYMYNKQNSSEVTGVTGATVQIGKNKEYTAYQVYMYYPSDSTYLITYWFEAEDGKVHYIALEGPGELNGTSISDYLFIPESFSLNNNI